MRDRQQLLYFANNKFESAILNWSLLLDELQTKVTIDLKYELERAWQHANTTFNFPRQKKIEFFFKTRNNLSQRTLLPLDTTETAIAKWLNDLKKVIPAIINTKILGIDLKLVINTLLSFYAREHQLFDPISKMIFHELIISAFIPNEKNTHLFVNCVIFPTLNMNFLWHGFEANDPLLIETLFQLGIETKKPTTQQIDRHGFTPWSLATTRCASFTRPCTIDNRELQRLLKLFHGASSDKKEIDMNNDHENASSVTGGYLPSTRFFGFETALSAAIFHECYDNAVFMLHLGANINAIIHNHSGFTALHWAMTMLSLLTLQLQEFYTLITQIEDANFPQDYVFYITSEMRALSAEKKSSLFNKFSYYIRALLLFGASETIKNKSGLTPLAYLTLPASQLLYAFEAAHEHEIENVRKEIVKAESKGMQTLFWLKAREVGNTRTKTTTQQKLKFKG